MKRKRYWLWPFVGIAFIALATLIVMLLWNHIVIEVIPQVKALTYWQAMGLLALCKILFGSGPRNRFRARGHGGGGRYWRNKWRNMSEEEKMKVKEEWRKKCEKWND